jgi:hypothetical protein
VQVIIAVGPGHRFDEVFVVGPGDLLRGERLTNRVAHLLRGLGGAGAVLDPGDGQLGEQVFGPQHAVEVGFVEPQDQVEQRDGEANVRVR